MKSISKIAALIAACCVVLTAMYGCRDEKELLERLGVITDGCNAAISLTSGEIMVYETFKPEANRDDKILESVTETYAKFIQEGSLEYDYTGSKKYVSTEKVDLLEATQSGGELIVTRNGVVVSNDEALDIFEYFRIDYTVADIENIDIIETTGESVMLYAVTMSDSYADKFDGEADGVATDCNKVIYNYYFDYTGTVRDVMINYELELEYNGETQSAEHFVQATIE